MIDTCQDYLQKITKIFYEGFLDFISTCQGRAITSLFIPMIRPIVAADCLAGCCGKATHDSPKVTNSTVFIPAVYIAVFKKFRNHLLDVHARNFESK